MKWLLTLVLLLVCNVCIAEDYTEQRIGNFTYVHGNEGTDYTAQKIGNFTYYNGDIQGTSQQIGSQTYYHINDSKPKYNRW